MDSLISGIINLGKNFVCKKPVNDNMNIEQKEEESEQKQASPDSRDVKMQDDAGT